MSSTGERALRRGYRTMAFLGSIKGGGINKETKDYA